MTPAGDEGRQSGNAHAPSLVVSTQTTSICISYLVSRKQSCELISRVIKGVPVFARSGFCARLHILSVARPGRCTAPRRCACVVTPHLCAGVEGVVRARPRAVAALGLAARLPRPRPPGATSARLAAPASAHVPAEREAERAAFPLWQAHVRDVTGRPAMKAEAPNEARRGVDRGVANCQN